MLQWVKMIFASGFLMGTVLGSFVKVLADRSLSGKSFFGRSYCPKCQKRLGILDLIPLFSYISLRGRCRYCQEKIGMEYFLVEMVMGLLIGFLFWQNLQNLQFTIYNLQFFLQITFKIFFITILVALFLTDLKKMLLPDRITLPAIGITLIYLLITQHSLWSSLITGLSIAAFFWIIILITRGKGMGGGDVKLGLLLGLALGFPDGLIALMLSFFLGSIVALALIFSGRKKLGGVIPFGPFLVMGGLISLFWGGEILKLIQ